MKTALKQQHYWPIILTMNDLAQRFQDFDIWAQRQPGAQVIADEAMALSGYLSHLIGQHALLLGSPLQSGIMEECAMTYSIDRKFILKGWGEAEQSDDQNELVIRDHSMDLVVLPHTLEYVYDAKTLLNDVTRILHPAGYVMIVGFRHWHPWVLKQQRVKQRCRIPWGGKLPNYATVRECLDDLHYDIIVNKKVKLSVKKNLFLSLFTRVFGGEAYMILARKKSLAKSALTSNVKAKNIIKQVAPAPEVTRNLNRE